jgi:hypothetical protein
LGPHTRAVDPYIQRIRLPILAIRSGREDGESADTWRTRRPWWLRRKYGEAMALPRPPIHCPRTPGSKLNLQRYLSPSSFLQPPNEGVSEAPSPCPSPWVRIRLLQLAGDTVDFWLLLTAAQLQGTSLRRLPCVCLPHPRSIPLSSCLGSH